MLRCIALFTLLVCLGLVVPPTHAYGNPSIWTAWLNSNRHMLLIDSTGQTQQELLLPVPDGFVVQPSPVVSDNGRLIFYVSVSAELAFAQPVVTVFDANTKTIRLSLTLENAIIPSGQHVFNRLSNALVFGYQSVDPAGNAGSNWVMLALDLATGKTLYQLDSAHSGSVNLSGTHFPTVQFIDRMNVQFRVTAPEAQSLTEQNNYIWNMAMDEVHSDTVCTVLFCDIFTPTGEVVMSLKDTLSGLTSAYVYDPTRHARFPFYQGEGLPLFVQNGQRILLMQDASQWTVVERDGKEIGTWEMPPGMSYRSVWGTLEGFVYLLTLALPNSDTSITIPAVVEVNTRDTVNAGRTVWYLSPEKFRNLEGADGSLEIVWVGLSALAGPFKPWAQLAEPVYDTLPVTPEVLIQPTLIPTPEPLYHAGMTVRVQTTGGEILNLRESPTRDSEVIMYLKDKMEVTLLDGPLQAEGYTWWRIRTTDGIEGWAVNFNGELQTLMPITNPE